MKATAPGPRLQSDLGQGQEEPVFCSPSEVSTGTWLPRPAGHPGHPAVQEALPEHLSQWVCRARTRNGGADAGSQGPRSDAGFLPLLRAAGALAPSRAWAAPTEAPSPATD